MSTLKEKAQQVLEEKGNKIIPENIKNGVEIFDVTGSYKGGSGTIDLTDGRKFGHSTFSELPDDIVNANWKDIDDAAFMFYNCENLQSIPLLDTSNITNMGNMFYNCVNLRAIPQFNISNVTDMSTMFYNCVNLQTIPQLNTGNVTNMNNMFGDCANLQSIPLLDTSKVIDMSTMFYNCKNLTTIPLLDTSNVTTMNSMFMGCRNLQTVPQLNTSNVTDMSNMFNDCMNLASVPRLNIDRVMYFTTTFAGCYDLQSLDLYYINPEIIVNYDGMLDEVPDNCEITVKTQAQKDWLVNNVRSDLTNIQVVGITHNVTIDSEDIEPITTAYEGDTVKLKPVEIFKIITSFKLNGVTVQGNSFIMPQEDAVITDVVIKANYVIESEHPYSPSIEMVDLWNGDISGASKLKVDVEYNLEPNYDYVYINYFDENGSAQKVYNDGTDDLDYRYTDTFYTENNHIQIIMNTDGGTQRWGVKVTLTRLDQDGNPID